MMLVGLSLGGCLRSILAGEVSKDDVLVIITRTDCPEFNKFIDVVRSYIEKGNMYATIPDRYDFTIFDPDEVIELATYLWEAGKIHQPRTFGTEVTRGSPGTLWLEVVPTNTNSNPSVVDAYEKYKMLDNLTK